jgi:uncharacterized alpha-E superfamily protein
MLLCRLAENAFWLGRYLERVEGLSRAILAYEAIRLDIPGQRAPGWQRLAACAGVEPAEAADLEPAAFVARVILERQNPSSLLGALHAARENLRRARSLFPAECWHTLNPLYLGLGALTADMPPAELRQNLERAVAACRELGGHIATGMLRDEGYAFFRMGVLLERSDMMLRVATIVADTLIPVDRGMPFEDVRWMGLLKSVGAYGTYRHRYHAATDLGSALQLLLFEPKFPRSLAYGLDEIRDHLALLPRNEDPHSALEACRPAYAVERAALHDFADDMLARLAHASSVLEATYFSLASPAPEEARPVQAPTRRRAAASATTLESQQGRDSEPLFAPVT